MPETRKEQFERKREEILKRCTECRKRSATPPSYERCDDCSTGRRLRMLEAEYRDVVGFGAHKDW